MPKLLNTNIHYTLQEKMASVAVRNGKFTLEAGFHWIKSSQIAKKMFHGEFFCKLCDPVNCMHMPVAQLLPIMRQ